jgi:hypothetical protein
VSVRGEKVSDPTELLDGGQVVGCGKSSDQMGEAAASVPGHARDGVRLAPPSRPPALDVPPPTSRPASIGKRDGRAHLLPGEGEPRWGYLRIVGELKKLGLAVSKTSVAAVLRRQGFGPGPMRAGLSDHSSSAPRRSRSWHAPSVLRGARRRGPYPGHAPPRRDHQPVVPGPPRWHATSLLTWKSTGNGSASCSGTGAPSSQPVLTPSWAQRASK